MAMANQILPIHKEPNSRNSITQKAIFLRLSLPTFSPEAIDEAIMKIRGGLKKDEKEELFICFTDVNSTPHNIVRKLLEKQITIIQQDIHKKACFADHFWRFTNYEKEKIQFVLYTRDDFLEDVEFHSLVEQQVMYPEIIQNGIQNENFDDKSLVFSNYPTYQVKAADIIEIITWLFMNTDNKIPNLTAERKGYSIFEFEEEKEASLVFSRLQNRVLHFYPKNPVDKKYTETSESNTGTDHQDLCENPSLLDKLNQQQLNQQPGIVHQLEHENAFDTDGEQQSDELVYEDRKKAYKMFEEDTETMAIVFWDIQNCKADEIIPAYTDYVRKTFITSRFKEEAFVCVRDMHDTPDLVIQDLSNSGVIIVHMHTETKQTADKVIIQLMEKYSSNRPGNARIILITGDKDYLDAIYRTKIIDRNDVCLIYSANCIEKMKISVERNLSHDIIKEILISEVEIKNPQTVNFDPLDEDWIDRELQITGYLINNHPYYTFVTDEKVSAERYITIFEQLSKINYNCKVINICYGHDSFYSVKEEAARKKREKYLRKTAKLRY